MSIKKLFLCAMLSAVLVVMGHYFVLQRPLSEPEEAAPRGDSSYYALMAKQNYTEVLAPFRFRVLVPALASQLPFSSAYALRAITYVSLFFLYLTILLICHELGIKTLPAFCGLVLCYAAMWQLYQFQNPFLVSAPALLFESLMLYFCVKKQYLPYVLAFILGILSHESAIFLVPLWFLVHDKKRGIAAVVVAVTTYYLVRVMVSAGDFSNYLQSTVAIAAVTQKGWRVLFSIGDSWNFIWILGMLGLWHVAQSKRKIVMWAAALILAGSILSIFFASDVGRMFYPLFLVFSVSVAALLNKVDSPVLLSGSVVMLGGAEAFLIQNVLMPTVAPLFFKVGLLVMGGLYAFLLSHKAFVK